MTLREIDQGMTDWSIGYNQGARDERETSKQLRARIKDLEERLEVCNRAIDELNAKNADAVKAEALFMYQANQMKEGTL